MTDDTRRVIVTKGRTYDLEPDARRPGYRHPGSLTGLASGWALACSAATFSCAHAA